MKRRPKAKQRRIRTKVRGDCVRDLIIESQFTEAGDVLGPLDKDQQLLLNGVTYVAHIGHFLLKHIDTADRRRYLHHTTPNTHKVIQGHRSWCQSKEHYATSTQ